MSCTSIFLIDTLNVNKVKTFTVTPNTNNCRSSQKNDVHFLTISAARGQVTLKPLSPLSEDDLKPVRWIRIQQRLSFRLLKRLLTAYTLTSEKGKITRCQIRVMIK